MASSKKPSAAARTIDIFSGKTPLEAQEEAERIASGADLATDAERHGVPMEERLGPWRDKAFEVQEWSSKLFPKDPAGRERAQYRVTRKMVAGNKMLYLERVYSGGDGKSVSGYTGLMLYEDEFMEFAKVVVEAARKVKADNG